MKALRNILIGLLLVVILFLVTVFIMVGMKTNSTKVAYSDIINKYSEEYKLNPIMVASIIKEESHFNNEAKSEMGAVGLMQLLPDTAKWVSEKLGEEFESEKLSDPDYNIKHGAYYYKYLLEHFGNDELALAAYNGGIGNVEKWLEDPEISKNGIKLDKIPFGETSNYVEKVMNTYKTYDLFYEGNLPSDSESSNTLKLSFKNYLRFWRDLVKDF